MQKKALGRGLDALIASGVAHTLVSAPPQVRPLGSAVAAAEPAAEPDGNGIRQLDIELIERSRFQPRTEFDPEQLRELADSIRQQGVVQPLLVRRLGDDTGNGEGRYELIAGERRWRAARAAGLKTVPVIVRQASDEQALEIALIENLQREDLNPIEEAGAYEQLATRFGLTQQQIAEKVGRSRAAVANAMRLLGLPEEVRSWIADGRLSVGHAKAILGLSIGEQQRLVAERVLRGNLTVRQTEELVEQLKGGAKVRARALGGAVKPAEIVAIEERLRRRLGTQVSVHHGRKKGRIEIEYYGNDELTRLLGILGVENL